LYCHLKKSSVAVRGGAKIEAGTEIGLAGQSGAALFPHLHLSLFHNGRIVDPFTGLEASGCSKKGAPMWLPGITLPYEPVVIYAAGFKGGAPDIDALKIDAAAPDTIAASSPVLALWAAFYGARRGDAIAFTVRAPDGALLIERSVTQEDDRPRQFYYAGYKASAPLAPGEYVGAVVLKRLQPDGSFLTRGVTRKVTIR
jgi:hypothetical protein